MSAPSTRGPRRSPGATPPVVPPPVDAFTLDTPSGRVLVITTAVDAPSGEPLTPAELEVAELVAAGLTNAAIAERRGCAARTVANQLQSIYRKLGVASRVDLARRFSPPGRPDERAASPPIRRSRRPRSRT